jgi:peptide/nickel transport system ATP-binding protein
VHGHLHEVVRGVSLRIRPGSVVALVGESGSGKSATAHAIMGLLPSAGRVTGGSIDFIDPKIPGDAIRITNLASNGPAMRALRGGRISIIFQEPMTSLSPLHTIGYQVEENLQLHAAVARADARAKTEEMLGLVGFPEPKSAYDRYPFELSGGLRQRAMIAMALICRPALLIADEPTTALDVTVQAQILALLKELQARLGMAILLITHDLGLVANMADEVVVMYHGEVMEAGSVNDVLRRPGHRYLKSLIKAVPHFDMKPGERLVALRDVKVQSLPRLSSPTRPNGSAKLDGASAGTVPVANAPLIEARGICKEYGSRKGGFFRIDKSKTRRVVDNVSFDLRKGECLGLVGESGCGKTTLSKILMRAITATSGEAVYFTETGPTDILALKGNNLKSYRRRLQMVFQDPFSSLSPRMTVLNLLKEPLDIHGIGTPADRSDRAQRLMLSVGLDPRYLSRYPHSFSGGQRQRLGIARALALDPDVLICDEPVSALDVSVQAQILNLFKDLQKELGLTYLFISHNLAVVDYVANRIAVMCRGRIVEIAPREVLFGAPIHPYTKALLKAVPYPDLDRPLDLKSLTKASASDEVTWLPQFRTTNGPLSQVAVGTEHLVLASANADSRELRP